MENVTSIATIASETENTELASFIQDLTRPRQTAYCSMSPSNEVEKKALFNAMNNPSKRVGDMINKKINLKNVFVEIVPMVNQETGEIQDATRIVLLDDKNEGYACVSKVIFSALKKLFAIHGTPEIWDKPIPICVKQIQKNAGNQVRNLLTFDLE